MVPHNLLQVSEISVTVSDGMRFVKLISDLEQFSYRLYTALYKFCIIIISE